MALTGVFIAITVVLNRFLSINIWNMSIGFSFVSVMLCGMLLGPIWGGVCGGLADLIGAVLFPFGTYFFGFTATAFLKGTVFGMVGRLAEKQRKKGIFIAVAVLILAFSEGVFSFLLNSLWISILYATPFMATLISRIPLCLVTFFLQAVFAVVLKEGIIPKIRKEI